MPTGAPEASSRGKGGFWTVFGTESRPTSVSEASRRVEGKGIVTVAGLMVKFATGFGTAPPATGGSEAGPRGEEGFYRHFGTGVQSTDASVASPCGERPADRSMTGN